MGIKLSGGGVAVLLCAGALAAAGTASASPAPIAEAKAEQQLRDIEAPAAAEEWADPTIALRDLALALPALDGAAERQARSILARPPDGNSPYGGSWPANAEEHIVERPAFVVHYVEVPGCDAAPPNPDANCDEPDLTDADGNDIPDYVDATVEAVDESIAVQNGELGWPLPKGDGDEGEPPASSEEDRFDVYISDLCDESDFSPCVFGFADPDDNSAECNSPPFKCSAHLVLDNDYDEFGESGGELGLRVTTAHEYNHVLQFNLDANQDTWMLESTATWSEEHVFPDDDDWLRTYMPSWVRESLIPITQDEFRVYGSAVWNHWLEHGDGNFGPDVILNAWESSRDVTPKDYAVGAYDDAIKDEGGAGFPQQFAAFAAATAEWRTGDGGFPDASELPNIKRRGKLALGARATSQRLDNTSYAQFKVNPEDASAITLKGRSGGGVQWSVALVGRDGPKTTGTVERLVSYSEGGRRAAVTLTGAQA
ncbi:MAG: hypothetical protein M3Y34_04935, partial [Actinomycetota bacterium]|nr:hypothetical protein [Actinomycetota bacterium]